MWQYIMYWARLLCPVPVCSAAHLFLDFSRHIGTALCCWCTIKWTVVFLVSRSVVRAVMCISLHQPTPSPLCASVGTAFVHVSHTIYSLGILLWWLLYVYTLHRTTAFFFAVRVIWRACESCQGGMQCLPGSGC